MVQGADKEKDLCKRTDSSMSTKGKERDGAAPHIQAFLRVLAARMVRKGCI